MTRPTPDDLIASDPPPAFPPWMVAADPRLAAQETNRLYIAQRRWQRHKVEPHRNDSAFGVGASGRHMAFDLLYSLGMLVLIALAWLAWGAAAAGVTFLGGAIALGGLQLYWKYVQAPPSPERAGDQGCMPGDFVVVGRSDDTPEERASTLLFLWKIGVRGSEVIEYWLLSRREAFRPGPLIGYSLMWLANAWILVWWTSELPLNELVLVLIPGSLVWMMATVWSRNLMGPLAINTEGAREIVETWEAAQENSAIPRRGWRGWMNRTIKEAVTHPVGCLTGVLGVLIVKLMFLSAEGIALSLGLAALVALFGFVWLPWRARSVRRRETPERWHALMRRADAAFEFALDQMINPDDPDGVRALLIRQGKLGLDDPWPPTAGRSS